MLDADTMIQDDADEAEEKSLSELLQEYTTQERCYRMEGASGVRNLEKIVKALGYEENFGGAIDNFLQDNPGALEALYDWIGEQDLPEWRDAILSELNSEDDADEGSDYEGDDRYSE